MEGGNSSGNNNNNYNSSSCMMMENGLYPMIMIPHHNHNSHHENHSKFCYCSSSSSAAGTGCYDHHHHHHHQNHEDHQHHLMAIMESQTQDHNNTNTNNDNNGVTVAINSNNNGGGSSSGNCGNIKAKIMAHPHYPRLLSAFVSCQKVGAPPEVVARLEEAEAMIMNQSGGRSGSGGGGSYVGEDPALDQFMEAYCEMLTKYEQELTKPFKEAMLFLSRIECQFKALTLSSPSDNTSPSSGDNSIPSLISLST